MSSPTPMNVQRMLAEKMPDDAAGSLDVSWLLPPKKDRSQKANHNVPANVEINARPPTVPQAEPTPPQSPTEIPDTSCDAALAASLQEETNGTSNLNNSQPVDPNTPPTPAVAPPSEPPKQNAVRPPAGRSPSNDENKSPAPKGPIKNLKNQGGRRSSWISNLSSKFSSSSSPTPSRSASVEFPTNSGPTSPKVEFGNPFNKTAVKPEPKTTKKEDKPVITHIAPQPRRQSVLVHAGQETKLENPGFLSSALRRLSSSNSNTLGKGAGIGAAGLRKTMNIDQNRERVKINELDQNNLKRVAFCVDVEIAGYGVQAEEEGDAATKALQGSGAQRQSLASLERQANIRKRDAKVKDKGEGAALKKPQSAAEEKEELGETKADIKAAADEAKDQQAKEESPSTAEGAVTDESMPIPTRKKEKKKRSEAERKERKERKRKQAEANGLVPLEITAANDDDSDSSPTQTPPGASTPNARNGDRPTTDPLRIYKRCCQLRETTALDRIKEQISKPSATLAEAPGTVACVDLSGTQMPLQDIVTLGDWLAVVPVRKLMLDDCSLTDEGLRVILSGLVGCKSAEQAKQNRKLPKRGSGKKGQEKQGVIERLSLKNNSGITKLGWKHIALFLHISRSLRAVDLSGIPFPKRAADANFTPPGDLSRTTTASSSNSLGNGLGVKANDIGYLITRAISERFAQERLEELIVSRCGLASSNVSDLVDAAIKCKIRKLGLADNSLSVDALTHVIRYTKSGVCEGLDLGGNNLHGTGHLVAEAFDENNPLFAISWANCNLDARDLELILAPCTKLQNFKFMDLSRNPGLFSGSKNAVQVFRKFLPRLKSLKRLHLCDVDMTSDDVIALAEILPNCSGLAHISILENVPLLKTMNSKDNASQEEACAFLVALMTAVRVSHSIVALELEVPSADSSEVVKALASQVVAYSLRNMEHDALKAFGVPGNVVPDKDAPEVLLHLVGHMEGYDENHDNDEPAPDEDYMIASTGIVKALGVCLGTEDHHSRSASRNISPSVSGPATPRQGPLRPNYHNKPKDVSLELCESARKIRMRLRLALIREDRNGDVMNYRRLLALDGTLERMIKRFEDQYPETKVPAASLPSTNGLSTSLGSSQADASILSASVDSNGISRIPSLDEYVDETPLEEGNRDPFSLKLSRTPSNTSLAAKALTHEEGRMLRFGQSMRRDLLKPTGTDDFVHGTSVNDLPEPEHLQALRAKLEQFQGEEIRRKVEMDGADSVIRELGINAEELMVLQREDPEGFQAFRQSQLAAQINAGMTPDPRNGNGSGQVFSLSAATH